MGTCSSSDKVSPLGHEAADCVIAEKRSSTDSVFLIAFVAFLLGLTGLLAYTIHFGDIYRIINGFDDCGNVCGRVNSFGTISGCAGADMTQQTYLIVKSTGTITHDAGQVHRKCAIQCPEDSFELLNRCLPGSSEKQTNKFFSKTGIREFFQEVNEDIAACYNEIIYMFAIAFVTSVIILMLFKYSAAIVVWFVLAIVVVICIVGTTLLWQRYLLEEAANRSSDIGKRRKYTLLTFAVIATIVTMGVILVILVLRKRIKLVIRLFKEAGEVVIKMPLLLFEPVLTFVFLLIIISMWLYFSVWIESAGFLSIENTTSAEYMKDRTMIVARWYNVLAFLWLTQFVIACQHIVIAGAVATWFFSRDKDNLDSPIANSFDRLIRHHLGTAACGSLLVASVQFLRVVLSFIQFTTRNASNRFTKCISNCCQTSLSAFETCMSFISRQAYIETAIHGYPFFTAGKMAINRLSANSLRVLVIDSIGDFVLFLGKAAVVVLTVVAGMEMLKTKDNVHHMWLLLVFAGVFAYLVAHTFISVYEMTIDTIFLCFCEDYEYNDGMDRPYYMSRGLMEFVETTKSILEKHSVSKA